MVCYLYCNSNLKAQQSGMLLDSTALNLLEENFK